MDVGNVRTDQTRLSSSYSIHGTCAYAVVNLPLTDTPSKSIKPGCHNEESMSVHCNKFRRRKWIMINCLMHDMDTVSTFEGTLVWNSL